MGIRWIAIGLLLAPCASAQSLYGLSDLERASGWVSMSDESGRKGWTLEVREHLLEGPKNVWAFDGPVLRRAAGTSTYFGWNEILSEFEIDFEWRDHRQADNSWHPGRIVMRRDNSALALLAEQRIDRAANSDMPSFRAGPFELTPAQSQPGWHIALMPGESEFELRGMRLRDRAKPIGKEVELFDGKTLTGWRALGDAKFTVENGELIGEVGGGSQSFLATEKSFGDFIFEVDVKNDLPGNSGIQVRSHENDQKRLFGYQIEIDPSARAWSGGLYDEARRGWLDDLSDNPHGRAAFKSGEWNHYRIECIGPWIRAWVNDVPTADYLDAKDLEGVIGLQVHAGKDTKVRWRGFRSRSLGRSHWFEPPEESLELPQKFPTIIRTHTAGRGYVLGAGGGLQLRYEHSASDRGESAPITLLDLEAPEWLVHIPVEKLHAGELVILCYPPRLAIEIDGTRITGADYAPCIWGDKERIVAWVGFGDWTESRRYLLRD